MAFRVKISTGIGSPTSKSACMIYDETKGSRTGAGFGFRTGAARRRRH